MTKSKGFTSRASKMSSHNKGVWSTLGLPIHYHLSYTHERSTARPFTLELFSVFLNTQPSSFKLDSLFLITLKW